MKRNNQKGSYDPRYYTMDRLGEISLSNVNINLKQFMHDYDVTDYPIDCFKLVKKIQETALIHLQVLEEGRMSPAFNAVAAYFPEQAQTLQIPARKRSDSLRVGQYLAERHILSENIF